MVEGKLVQPYPYTPYVQLTAAVAALAVTAAATVFTVTNWREERNARLVEIGISVLRADPQKEPSAAIARKWALDLIDANAGGVRFSPETRKRLLEEALPIVWGNPLEGVTWGNDAPSSKKKFSN